MSIREENKNCWLTSQCSKVDCGSFCLKKFKLGFLYDEALIPESQRRRIEFAYDESDEDNFAYLSQVERNIENFVSQGGNLYIHSPNTGNGKTSWALRMVQAYFDAIWLKTPLKCRALFVHVPRFLIALKDNISEKSEYVAHIKECVMDADLVIWDEIGTKGLTQFEHENMLNLVDSRVYAGKANIYTSNLTDEELRKAVGERLYSRVALLSDSVHLCGTDKRAVI